MEVNNRSKTLVRSVEEVRRLLQPALFQLQEREKFSVGSIRDRVMETSDNLAEIIGSLYHVGQVDEDQDPKPDVASTVTKAYAKLERLLQDMGDLPDTEKERRDVAQALAILFALGVGPRSSCPPPRRSSTSMRAVRIPETPQKSKTGISSPSIELGEIDATALDVDLSPSIELGEIDAGALGLDLDAPPSSRRAVPASNKPSDDAPGSERRTKPRVAFEVDVGFVSESHFYAGLSMDVSDGGLFVATYRLQPVGSTVAVTFILPSGYAITTNAVVRWVREESDGASPGMGLAFELTGEDRKQVRAFCNRREPLFMDVD